MIRDERIIRCILGGEYEHSKLGNTLFFIRPRGHHEWKYIITEDGVVLKFTRMSSNAKMPIIEVHGCMAKLIRLSFL